jgi:hypothetical protein
MFIGECSDGTRHECLRDNINGLDLFEFLIPPERSAFERWIIPMITA